MAGSAARTTAAVPRRLTAIVRSHTSVGTSVSAPGTSVPAQVTTPRRSAWRSATWRTTSSASFESARSTCSNSLGAPPSGGRRSRFTGRPPAPATAATMAAPSPEEPPVTTTVPRGVGSTATADGLLEESGGGAALEVGDGHDLAAPLRQGPRLRQVGAGVVGALREDRRAQPLEHLGGGVLVEHHHGVHRVEPKQH